MGIRPFKDGESQKRETQEEEKGPPLRFPQGTRALFREVEKDGRKTRIPLADTEKVTLVNCSLTTLYIRDRDYGLEPDEKGKWQETTVKMLPGATHELTVLYARRNLAVQDRDGEIGFELVVAPPPGDCRGKIKFQKTEFGDRWWKTCPYGKCETCGPLPPNVYWSVWQAQHRIARLGSEDAISYFIEKFDPRQEVMAWGLRHIKARVDNRNENMGLNRSRTEEDTVN